VQSSSQSDSVVDDQDNPLPFDEIEPVHTPHHTAESQELQVLTPKATASPSRSDDVLVTLDVTKLETKSQASVKPSPRASPYHTTLNVESKEPGDGSSGDNERDAPRFDPKGKSVATGKSITGWL